MDRQFVKKNFQLLILGFVLVMTFFCFSHVVFASESYGIINADKVNFRSEPKTGNNVYEQLSKGTSVTIKNAFAVKGAGCSEGWIQIYYKSKTGYVCKSYINIDGKDSLLRPWTTPKLAIMGGALFTARGYISAGQNTSYLKKFNVNPDSLYSIYKNQYMANLAAPASEAATSYSSYKENGLLNLPLVFEIPIYENMPDETSHPTSGKQDYGQSEVTDKNFEKLLDEEEFPESYKVKLRLLHNDHPNWIFKSLKTGLQFNDVVKEEKAVSSISACNACYEQPLDSTEKGWYVANDQTVAYYIDPRNFLRENRILMFEDLSYKEEYTSKVVASVLKGTFMDGVSVLDNQSYADIFVEAGKNANVSPVYLASLARQESGTKVGLTTSGERFTYEDQTYEGFFNFFNIGAYSSESNPAKAGLVYASSGATKNKEGVFVGSVTNKDEENSNSSNESNSSSSSSSSNSSNSSSGTSNSNNSSNSGSNNESESTNTTSKPVEVFNVSQVVTEMNVKLKDKFIVNVNPGLTVGTIRKKTMEGNVTFKQANGQVLSDKEVLGTGDQIVYKDGTVHTIVVYGDLTGDGVINSADLLRMRQYLLGQINLSGAYLESAKTTHGTKVNSADLLRLRQHLLGTLYIVQV